MNDLQKNEAERRLREQRNAALQRRARDADNEHLSLTPPSATVAALHRICADADQLAGELARLTKERNELYATTDALFHLTCRLANWLGNHNPSPSDYTEADAAVVDRARHALALCGKGAQ